MLNRTVIKEIKTELPLPYRIIITGIYKEKGRWVIRKFEQQGLIQIPIDEEFVLNSDDAEIVLNIMNHKTHSFTLN